MVKVELKLSNKFLDTHSMGMLERKIWDFLERYELFQGDLEEINCVKIKLVAESDHFYDTKKQVMVEWENQ